MLFRSAHYGLLVASIIPFEMTQIVNYDNTIMGRGFINVQVIDPISEKKINIITTHLESTFKFQSVRELQIKQLSKYIIDQNIQDQLVFCGDLNTNYTKIYTLDKILTSQADFTTWFGNRFHNINRSCRFDRIFTGASILTNQIKPICDTKIDELNCYPSDHNGIMIDLGCEKS